MRIVAKAISTHRERVPVRTLIIHKVTPGVDTL